ncbi:MAG: hypothetical protein H7Z19_09400 [Chitinophagaceae bacterium]|nr:hypothetical protein [Rubrivivax sp.]
MSLVDLINQVAQLAGHRLPPRAAVAELAPLLAAFVAEPANRFLPQQARRRRDGARFLLNHPADPFQIVVVPWAAGSRGPIHDQAGAAGAMAALSGATIETKHRIVEEDAAGVRLAPVSTLRLYGRIVTPLLPEDGPQLRELVHAQGEPAATLHVHLRRLVTHNVYLPQPDGSHRRQTQGFTFDDIEAWRWWSAVPMVA